jgi:hypothetical protein
MRISLVIMALAAIAVAVVHVHREDTRTQHAVQQLQIRQIELRRKLYDQQAELGHLTAPPLVRRRAEVLDIALTECQPIDDALAETPAAGRRGRQR